MSTDKSIADNILYKLIKVANCRIRPMFGEYVLYADNKVIGQINEGVLFIKFTKDVENWAQDLKKASPYKGAKEAFIVPKSKLNNIRWLSVLIQLTFNGLK